MSEMTHNQALQELTRIENMWQAAAKLKESLQLATNVEATVARLRADEARLTDSVEQARRESERAMERSTRLIEEATLAASRHKAEMEELMGKRSQEYANQFAKKEKEMRAAIATLEADFDKRQQAANATLMALDEDIERKEFMVRDLNGELDNLRQRLG